VAAAPAPPPEQVRAALLKEARERGFGEGRIAEPFHLVLMAVVAALALDNVPNLLLAAWVVAVVASVAARGVLRRRLRTREFDPGRLRAFRASIAALALSWGVGAGIFSHLLPFDNVALVLVVLSGMVAAATATLAADTAGFRIFLAGTNGPFMIGLLTGPLDATRLAALLLVLLYSTAMLALHQRAHAVLLERTATMLRLAESEAAAARERAQLDSLFVNAPLAIVVVDEAGRVLNANPRFQTLFGYSLAEAQGQRLNDLIVPPPETGHAEMLDETVRGGATVVADVRRCRKGGELIPVRASAARIEDAEGQKLFVLYEDISDEVQARRALEDARLSAERVAQMRSAFLANMSHEIRTPLNAVLGLTELLLDGELSSEQRRSLDLIQTSGEALLTLLNDILDLSKIEAESLHLEAVTFELPRLVDSAVGLLAVRARERGVELLTDIASDVPEQVRADPTRLRQVLTNLVGNAIKFTHEGEVLVSLARVGEEDAGKATVRFAVRDTGIGIPADQLTAIFQPFSQADLSMARKYGGTGLGLTIAQRLVGMMGGTLQVTSEVGKGSEFTFTVDVMVEPGLPVPLPSPTAVPLEGLRMLIVDDNQSNRRIVREMLAAVGAAVTEAGGADEGLAELGRAARAHKPFALAILDAQMPGRDGFELAAMARADPALKPTRLLMLTSAGQRGDAQRCRELGIRGYLTKPVSRADLLDMVAGVLGGPEEGADATPEVVTRHRIHESRRQLRVLLAEDNQVNQEVAATMLRKRGHQVDVVDDGRQAVERCRRGRYDVVLMDIQMPEMDGLEATRAIRELPGGRDLPIVALTAHALKTERDRCLAQGMNAYVTKPFKAYELFAAAEGWGAHPATPGAPERLATGAASARAAKPGAAPSPPGTERAPVDLESFRKEMTAAGAGEAVKSVIDSFIANMPTRIAAIAEAVAAGRAPEVARIAHTGKSSAAQLGAQRLATLLGEVERDAKDGKRDALRDRLEPLRKEAEAAVEYLRSRV
jgi:two-component system sensor histidine kinase/response regulator